MSQKLDYAVVVLLLEGNFLKKERLKGLIELCNSTEDHFLETKINKFLDLIDSGEDSRHTFVHWNDLLTKRREDILQYANLSLLRFSEKRSLPF